MRQGGTHRLKQVVAFFDSRPLAAGDLRLVERYLAPPERALFLRLRRSDQRHSVAVARHLAAEAQLSLRERWIAIRAALLHDVGKDPRGATLPVRVANTLFPALPGWLPQSLRRSVVELRHHGERGAALLRRAGTDPAVVALVRRHDEGDEASDLPEGLRPLLTLLQQADARC